MPPPHYVKFPWREHPQSEVRALVIVEMTNPGRQFAVKCEHLLGITSASAPCRQTWSTNPNPTRRNRMRKLSRRSLVASAATLPALVVPAASATAIATASGHPDSRLLELERQIVALDAASHRGRGISFGMKTRGGDVCVGAANPRAEGKENRTAKPEPDPDLERALAKYGDRISRTVRDILPDPDGAE